MREDGEVRGKVDAVKDALQSLLRKRCTGAS